MQKNGIILICILVLSYTLGNTKRDPHFSKEYFPRESPRSLEDIGNNYIIVEYKNFTGNATGFPKLDFISHVYLDDEKPDYKDYRNNISSLVIKPCSKIILASIRNMYAFFEGLQNIRSIDFSHCNSTQVTQMRNTFKNCKDLESINFGDNFDTTKVTDMYSIFEGCSSLTSIDLSKFNTESVVAMMSFFSGCKKLTEINLKSFNTKNLLFMNKMFEGCSSLRSLDLSTFVTDNIYYMTAMFSGCSELTSINLGNNFNTEKVDMMNEMFKGCVKLTSLDLSQFKTPSLHKMQYMFDGCSSLVVLDISNFYIKNDRNLENEAMFRGLHNLKYLNIRNIELVDYDLSRTDLNSLANLTVCRGYGATPFSNTNSKIFRCCDTPFDTSKCKESYIIILL